MVSESKKILVLHSGGLDSTVLLHKAFRDVGQRPENVKALNIVYGQKHEKEKEYAEWHCARLGIEQLTADLSDVFKFNPSVSTLLKDSGKDIEHSSYAAQTARADGAPVATYVPYRNGLFLSYAAAVAYQLGFNTIFYGAHRDDVAGAAYPDCSVTFIAAQARAIEEGTGGMITLSAPWMYQNKADIVRVGKAMGMSLEDFAHTWSCYEGDTVPCGTCSTCLDRKKAFEINGITDIL